MISILFVDDEPNILSGLQRLLRPLRHEWEMTFANSGVEALQMLAQQNVDVLVSDMKMPGMDGAQLLQQVSQEYPHLVRIILSGYAEKDLILRAINVAHQYLPKPCDAETLKATVHRACMLRELLDDATLRRLVTQMTMMPSLPTLYQQLTEELQAPEPSLKKVSEIVQQDIGMTAKLLQISNSAFFGLQRNVASTREAVTFLGLDTVTALALGIGVFVELREAKLQSVMDQLWEHSLKIASLAQLLAKSEAPMWAAHAFTAGLLHDIGEAILAVNQPHEYASVLASMEHEHLQRQTAEMQVYGISHATIGAYLLGLWGMPAPIVEAVAYHEKPSCYPSNTFTALTAVHIAHALVQANERDLLLHPEKYFDTEYLQRLHLWEKIPDWCSTFLKKEM